MTYILHPLLYYLPPYSESVHIVHIGSNYTVTTTSYYSEPKFADSLLIPANFEHKSRAERSTASTKDLVKVATNSLWAQIASTEKIGHSEIDID